MTSIPAVCLSLCGKKNGSRRASREQKERLVENNRVVHGATIAVCVILLCAVQRSAHADTSSRHTMEIPNPALPGSQHLISPADDFAGLGLSDEQKSEIEKIRTNTEMHRGLVAKNPSMNSDQKDAMIEGYTRQEYTRIFRILTPIQQKIVRQRVMAHRAAEMDSKNPQAPSN